MHRVLVVDDDPLVGKALLRLLRSWGLEAEVVASAAEGLSALDRFSPDVVLSDYLMPNMNGLDFLEEVERRRPGLRRVLLSGTLHELGAATSGVKLVPKPWSNEVLKEILFGTDESAP